MDQQKENLLREAIGDWQEYIGRWSREKGFWNYTCPLPNPDNTLVVNKLMPVEHNTIKATKLMLVVSELGECLEAIRKGDKANEVEEIADAVIRLLDYAGTYRLQLADAIIKKMAVNEGRPYMHGKAF